MGKEQTTGDKFYTLIPLEDFKALMGVDDREDKLARFCLLTATLAIEKYCMRRLLRKKYFERIEFAGELLMQLKEYPVSEVLAAYTIGNDEKGMRNEKILEPEFYRATLGLDDDLPTFLSFSPALRRYRGLSAVKAVYWAGYCSIRNEELGMRNERGSNKSCFPVVPADLSSACLELAAWNFQRYKGRRVGMAGNIRGAGKEGEHFEMSMPENVKQLLEPYKRRVI